MASMSNSKRILDEDEEVEHFDDFTLASSWERFISEIEAVCRQWLADGPKNLLEKDAIHMDLYKGLYKVKSEFKYATKSYCMEYYFETNSDGTTNGKVGDWNEELHDLQLSFGVKEFLVIAPQSLSGVVLDAPEASKLLSAVAIALSNCSCLWPAFVPVHDPSRKSHIGIQNMGTVFTRRFEADCIGSRVPIKLMHLEGLYELFVSKFAYATMDVSINYFKVQFKMRLTYRTAVHDDEGELLEDAGDITKSSEVSESGANRKLLWDDDCPWSEWYSAEDPIRGFTLVAIWHEITAESSLDMAELENASPSEADKWFLYPNLYQNLGTTHGNTVGFASQLRLLVEALQISIEAKFIEDFVSDEKHTSANLKTPAVIPPPVVLDRVLKDLFHEVQETQVEFSLLECNSSRAIKGASLNSLFAQFCLHALWFGNCNIRAIAVLWIEFVREVRWCWEESQPLPRMPANGTIDSSTCLVNQKLHMLAICISKKRLQDKEYDVSRDGDFSSTHAKENLQGPGDFAASDGSEGFGSNNSRKISSGAATSMMLLKSRKTMYAPIIQDPPPMTEDMHEERLQVAQALGALYNLSGQLEKDILSSDMSAFKAANPDAVFEDFIRWYSPKDWENGSCDETEDSLTDSKESLEVEWPPCGRLSERMSDPENSWRKIWNDTPPLPASEQNPLFDPVREGEKVIHYLETLKPQNLLEQMVCTAFSAAADTLGRTSFGDLEQMTTKMGQLYITIASILKYMQSANMTHHSDVIEDLRELCVTFERMEKLITLAASLHRKFLQTPHLAKAFFNDYCDYYLPIIKKGLVQGDTTKEFDKRLEIRQSDRNTISDMFAVTTAYQSSRVVMSMGNLLNGNEPISRELMFYKRDRLSGSYYDSGTSRFYQQDIETHRMYVCGTSNDIRVALGVTSWD